MTIAWFDCYAGISGDMCLGALVDAGVDLNELTGHLSLLNVGGYRLQSRRVLRNGIAATKVDVVMDDHHNDHDRSHSYGHSPARRWHDIEAIITGSSLAESVKGQGLTIFRRIFEAEGKVHGVTPEEAHLHELGAVDCLVDILGTLCGLKILGVNKVFCSPVNVGSGSVRTSHGILPVPAPATLELLKGYPVYSASASFELITPTGAAILSGLGAVASSMPRMTCERTGYGAGNRDPEGFSNTLRLVIGTPTDLPEAEARPDTVCVIETNIDDMNPQVFDAVMEKLLGAGALDVFLENIIMKKGRPALKLSVIAAEDDAHPLCAIILRETTTLGVRFYTARRQTLRRSIRSVETEFGPVDFKIGHLDDGTVKVSPEYDHVRAIAEKTGIPLRELLTRLSRHEIAPEEASKGTGSPPFPQ